MLRGMWWNGAIPAIPERISAAGISRKNKQKPRAAMAVLGFLAHSHSERASRKGINTQFQLSHTQLSYICTGIIRSTDTLPGTGQAQQQEQRQPGNEHPARRRRPDVAAALQGKGFRGRAARSDARQKPAAATYQTPVPAAAGPGGTETPRGAGPGAARPAPTRPPRAEEPGTKTTRRAHHRKKQAGGDPPRSSRAQGAPGGKAAKRRREALRPGRLALYRRGGCLPRATGAARTRPEGTDSQKGKGTRGRRPEAKARPIPREARAEARGEKADPQSRPAGPGGDPAAAAHTAEAEAERKRARGERTGERGA